MKKLGSVIISVIVAMCIFAFAACDGGESGEKNPAYTYTLTDTSVTLNEGQTKQISVNVTPSKEISPEFTSDNPEVAVVSESGLIRAVGEGNTTVKASVDGKTLTCSVTVKAYVLNFTGLGIIKGDTRQLTVTHGGESVASVTYSSDKTEVATVTDNGLVTAVGAGSAVITAAVDGIEILCNVTVTEEYVYSLNKTAMDLGVGLTESLSVSVTPNKEFDRPLVFTSDNPEVATVGEGNGEVTGVGIGSATITCMADGNELTCAVNVSQYTLSQTSLELRMGTSSSPLTVTVNPDRDIDVEFSSDNEEIATVNGEGVVTPVAIGNTVIKAKVGAVTLSCDVSVLAAYSYGLNKDNAKMSLGSTQQLTVTVEPDKELGEITWSSSDASVATVTDNGLVTAAGMGSAVITAKVDGETLTCDITVIISAAVTSEESYGKTYNLTKLDENFKTLDWVYYGNADNNKKIERMKNRTELIGAAPENDRFFGDYRAVMTWHDGENENVSLRRRDGWVFIDSIEQNITVNNKVSKAVLFVGSWQATVGFSVWMNGVKLDEAQYEGNPRCVRAVTVTPDVAKLKDGENAVLSVRIDCVNPGDGGNTCMVAVAVVGNTETHDTLNDSAALTKTELAGQATESRNLTEIGTTDWYYSHYEHDEGDHKNGGSAIKWDSVEYQGNRSNEWGYKCGFTRTDGTNWQNNPIDKNENWGEGVTVTTNNMFFCDNYYAIKVHLGVGTHRVYLYMTGWNAIYNLSVMDSSSNMLLQENIYGTEDGANHAFEVIVTLTVTQEGDFTFRSDKLGWEGNLGFAAVAVATQPEA